MPTRITEVVSRQGAPVRVVQVASLEVRPSEGAPSFVRLSTPRFTIGSHETNDLVLADDTVSKHHLQIDVTDTGYRITDLSSSNGTFFGTARLGEVTTLDPLTLRVGHTELRFNLLDEHAEIPATEEPRFGRLLGGSVVMRELFAQLERVAPSDCPVLLEGETGTGKELCAESLHAASPRAEHPFVVVDCGAVAPDVVESELFGHVAGAFTGADNDRRGLVEMSSGGTLFLDEIGELPWRLQAKLLGVLDRGELSPVGSSTTRPVDVRVVAATHRDLAREVNEGRFRGDLFYRLAVARIRLPALRERLEDLPLLVQACLQRLKARGFEAPEQVSSVALARLADQPWPGNVRELYNAVERLVVAGSDTAAPALDGVLPYREARDRFVDEFTRRALVEAVTRAGGNLAQAARALGVEARYFRRLVAAHHIPVDELRRR
jgi:two-component system, NtrC family, response regulator GlrR